MNDLKGKDWERMDIYDQSDTGFISKHVYAEIVKHKKTTLFSKI